MADFSTRQVARKLGLGVTTLARYVEQGKVPAPRKIRWGGFQVHVWSEEDIEYVRELLPKIANGRKTRYQKSREKQETQPRAAALQKTRRTKKKK
jgi:predicted DNA-binding transcriptional regulator AlpA